LKLVHLALLSIAACIFGMVVLLAVTLSNSERIQELQAEIGELLVLKERIDDISVASDSLLLFGATPDLWTAYLAEARALQEKLNDLGLSIPDASKAARYLGIMTRQLEEVFIVSPRPDSGGTKATRQFVPLELPERSRIIMNQIAGHGIALDTAVGEALRLRQQAIAREATRVGAILLLSALLFGALAVIAFGLVHRRMAAPMQELTHVLKAIRSGDLDARAPVRGNDEMAELAYTLNQMLDYRNTADKRLRHYRQLIEGSEDLSGVCDAEYRYVLVNRAYAKRYSREPEQIEGRYLWEIMGEEQFERVRPCIEKSFGGEMQQFETVREFDSLGPRTLFARYFPIVAPDGQIRYVAAVITDITEQKEAEIEMQRQARMLDMAGHAARFGGWSVDLASQRVTWSNMVAEIHGMPHGYSPTFEEGIAFYTPEYRERIQKLVTACIESGEPFDDELQIINTGGERVWVRAIGEAVHNESGQIIRIQGAFQDISALKSAEREKESLSRRMADILGSITDAFIALDHKWRFIYVNPEAERLTGRPVGELLGRNLWDEYPDITDMEFGRAYRRAMEEHLTEVVEGYYPPLEKWFEVRVYPTPEGIAIYFQDVTDRHNLIERLHEQEESLRQSRDRLSELLETRRALINSLPAHIALLDGNGTIVDVNEQWRHFGQLNAYPDADFGIGVNYIRLCETAGGDCSEEAAEVAQGLRQVLSGEREMFALEYPCHSPDEFRWFRVMVSPAVNPGEEGVHHGVVVMHVDITERKQAEQELNRLAYEDPLTGLPSRNGFTRILSDSLERTGWMPPAIVVGMDIAGQRDINDAHGYDTGDRVLIEIGRRLCEQAGEEGIVGRTGGDEFVLFLPLKRESNPDQSLAALSSSLHEPIDIGSQSIEMAVRFGYTQLANQPRPVESLLREAELALFQTRAEPGHSWVAYTSQLDSRVNERIRISQELRVALDSGQFELHFQPKVDLQSGSLLACEALLRWNHPECGLQSPGLFIPIAEQSQLIGPLGNWVLREACRLLRMWQDAGLEIVQVSINVSLIQFQLGDFPEKVAAVLAEFGLKPATLSLEITESVFERESESLLQQLQKLHEIGVRLSLDDFGTGYSSLLYLQRYPFDEIKVDQGFVQHILEDPYSRKIVDMVLGLASALKADTVAEGIETATVRDRLLEMGCRIGQGYFYSMPLAAEDFRWLLEKHSPLPLGGVANA